jgi:hypothetical protein
MIIISSDMLPDDRCWQLTHYHEAWPDKQVSKNSPHENASVWIKVTLDANSWNWYDVCVWLFRLIYVYAPYLFVLWLCLIHVYTKNDSLFNGFAFQSI